MLTSFRYRALQSLQTDTVDCWLTSSLWVWVLLIATRGGYGTLNQLGAMVASAIVALLPLVWRRCEGLCVWQSVIEGLRQWECPCELN
jgi:hypothetical protein